MGFRVYLALLRRSSLAALCKHAVKLDKRLKRDQNWKSRPWQAAYRAWSQGLCPALQDRGFRLSSLSKEPFWLSAPNPNTKP